MWKTSNWCFTKCKFHYKNLNAAVLNVYDLILVSWACYFDLWEMFQAQCDNLEGYCYITALMLPVCHGFGGKVPSYGEWKAGHQEEGLYCINM